MIVFSWRRNWSWTQSPPSSCRGHSADCSPSSFYSACLHLLASESWKKASALLVPAAASFESWNRWCFRHLACPACWLPNFELHRHGGCPLWADWLCAYPGREFDSSAWTSELAANSAGQPDPSQYLLADCSHRYFETFHFLDFIDHFFHWKT